MLRKYTESWFAFAQLCKAKTQNSLNFLQYILLFNVNLFSIKWAMKKPNWRTWCSQFPWTMYATLQSTPTPVIWFAISKYEGMCFSTTMLFAETGVKEYYGSIYFPRIWFNFLTWPSKKMRLRCTTQVPSNTISRWAFQSHWWGETSQFFVC